MTTDDEQPEDILALVEHWLTDASLFHPERETPEECVARYFHEKPVLLERVRESRALGLVVRRPGPGEP